MYLFVYKKYHHTFIFLNVYFNTYIIIIIIIKG